ncbi:hypothetical protein WH240_02000 [Gluconobacter wancherniae]|uniref:hypothetical protein n=1 Tax=Gluconobacter wancherniae TaxID=1307955 RepID=UPI0030A19C03
MQDDHQVTEDALRQALSRLGSGRSQNARHAQQPQERRRRFVRDGQVVVEHQNSRNAVPRVAIQDDQDEIERLKQSVKREQRRCEESERHLGEARAQIKVLETRAAHTRIQVTELSKELREHQDIIQTLKAQVHQARELAATAAQRSPRPVGRPRKERPEQPVIDEAPVAVSVPVKAKAEPEPVQWWLKG